MRRALAAPAGAAPRAMQCEVARPVRAGAGGLISDYARQQRIKRSAQNVARPVADRDAVVRADEDVAGAVRRLYRVKTLSRQRRGGDDSDYEPEEGACCGQEACACGAAAGFGSAGNAAKTRCGGGGGLGAFVMGGARAACGAAFAAVGALSDTVRGATLAVLAPGNVVPPTSGGEVALGGGSGGGSAGAGAHVGATGACGPAVGGRRPAVGPWRLAGVPIPTLPSDTPRRPSAAVGGDDPRAVAAAVEAAVAGRRLA